MAGTINLDRQLAPKTFPIADSVLATAAGFKRTYTEIVREVVACRVGPGKLDPDEYFILRLFDLDAVQRDQITKMVGRRRSYIHIMACNDIKFWWELTEDKLAFYAFMQGLGLPVPELQAVYHPTREMGRSVKMLRTEADVAAFLSDPAHLPLFMKPASLAYSLGTASLTGAADNQVTDLFGRTSTCPDLAKQIAALGADGDGYLFERTVQNHPDLVDVCGPALATSRVLVIRRDGEEPRIVRTHTKMPTGDNVADNTWRAGNLAVAVDPETGKFAGEGWTGKGLQAEKHTTHPDTGATLDGGLPMWKEARELIIEATKAMHGLRMIGWDLAISPDGPVLIEANADNDWAVNQRLTGQGLLGDADFAAFLDHCAKTPRTKS